MENKKCSQCHSAKSLSEFKKHNQKRDGLSPACKSCLSKKDKEYYQAHKETVLTKNTVYRNKNRTQINGQKKQHREANKEALIQKEKERYSANREQHLAKNRTFNRRYTNLKSSAKIRGLSLEITREQYIEIVKSAICFYCGESFHGSTGGNLNRVDSKKGYTINNVQPCCYTCNTMMSDFTLEELRGRLSAKLIERIECSLKTAKVEK